MHKYLKNLSIFLSLILLTSCSSNEKPLEVINSSFSSSANSTISYSSSSQLLIKVEIPPKLGLSNGSKLITHFQDTLNSLSNKYNFDIKLGRSNESITEALSNGELQLGLKMNIQSSYSTNLKLLLINGIYLPKDIDYSLNNSALVDYINNKSDYDATLDTRKTYNFGYWAFYSKNEDIDSLNDLTSKHTICAPSTEKRQNSFGLISNDNSLFRLRTVLNTFGYETIFFDTKDFEALKNKYEQDGKKYAVISTNCKSDSIVFSNFDEFRYDLFQKGNLNVFKEYKLIGIYKYTNNEGFFISNLLSAEVQNDIKNLILEAANKDKDNFFNLFRFDYNLLMEPENVDYSFYVAYNEYIKKIYGE
jgi:ABC-type phosphate/phosphonate transport system substrate-binding protein